ncbi:hypothetical protein [Sphingomonas yabuuchiae]|uniref:hypothetical protein n=1 Tax=Sphingomonas yabuuchiae TaxID=172044 RepID=UPI0025E7B783|nr:hypothetical protein [uncultured Sphingomonas sp.]
MERAGSIGLGDGLDALRAELSLIEVMRLIERTARWVDPATFRLLPVWYPEHSRRGLFYKADWSAPQMNRNRQTGVEVHKHEGNNYAAKALTQALGLRGRNRPNWSCCHIWGVDDATYASTNVIVQDPRYYSCVANMVLLPSPLKAFTDVMPEVKAMLRACAFHTYDWRCDHAAASIADLGEIALDPAYPNSWPRRLDDAPPPGVMPLTPAIQGDIEKRLHAIRRDLVHAGAYYPRGQVRDVLAHWCVELPQV